MFLATLAEKLSIVQVRGKDGKVTMHGVLSEWLTLRGKLSFEVLRSVLLSVRGSKKAWYKNYEVKI